MGRSFFKMIFIALFSFLTAEILTEIDSEVTQAIKGYEKLIEKTDIIEINKIIFFMGISYYPKIIFI